MTNKLEEFVNYEMNQVNESCEPSTVETNEIVSDMTQGKEVKGTHPDIKRSHGKSDLTVEDHPAESLKNHISSLEEMTDELGIQIRTARVGHYSCSVRRLKTCI